MTWNFLYLVRRQFVSSNNWGDMSIKTKSNTWEHLCYTYELPWKTYKSGSMADKSMISQSRIKIGTYEMKPRSDGAKGWRLQLLGTGHRTYIQIHRAHKSMHTEGCILPVDFVNFDEAILKKGNLTIQTRSVAIMNRIKKRYDILSKEFTGNPTITIAAILPDNIKQQTYYA